MRWPIWLIFICTCSALQAKARQPRPNGSATARTDTQSIRKLGNDLIAQARTCGISGQKEKCKTLIQNAIKTFADAGLINDLGFAYWEMSGCYDLSPDQFPDKIGYIQQAVNAWHKAGNIKKEADALKELADVRQINGNSNQSLTELKQALSLYLSIGEKDLQGVYDLLGEVSCDVGNLNDAAKYGLLAVQTAEQRQDSSLQLCEICNHLGTTYYYLQDYPHATIYFAKALAIAERYNSRSDIYIIAFNYGNNLIKLGKRDQCIRHLSGILKKYPGIDTSELILYTCSFLQNHTALKNLPQAKKYYDQLVLLTKNRRLEVQTQYNTYYNIARYLLLTGQNQQARIILQKLDTFVKDKSYSLMRVNSLAAWINLDSAVGDYQSAYRHFKTYTREKDSLYNRERSKSIALLNVQYETSKKDQDILLKAKDIELLKQNNNLQTVELNKANQVRNWSLAAGILLAIAVGLFIRLLQIKQRSNRNLRQQQEEIEKNNASLSQLVQEKEWLVKEIHHRVKNNFHMVIALLGTQSRYLRTSEAIKAITDSQNRIYAMALVHQKLYQSENLSAVLMPEYVRDLVHFFRGSLEPGRKIRFNMDICPVELSLACAIPLGLIINEAITNAIKYAFPDDQQGIISILLEQTSEECFILKITDNGISLPKNFNTRTSDSMGMKLMNGLSDDLDAQLTITGSEGTHIIVKFTVQTTDQPYFDQKNIHTNTTI